MGYKVNFDALDGLLGGINSQTSDWLSKLETLGTSIEGLAGSSSIKGDAADNIKNYISTVHGTILGLLGNLISLHSSNFLLYKQDYHQNIDTDLHANICEDTLRTTKESLDATKRSAISIDGEVRYALQQISDIFYYAYRDAGNVEASHHSVSTFLTDLDDEIKQLESSHLSSDFANTTELIASLKAFIADTSGTGRSYKTSFSPDKLSGSASFQRLYDAYVNVDQEINEKADAIETAIENENQRASALQKEYEEYLERQRKANIINWVVTGVCVVGSIAAVVATGGAATPLVVAGISAASSAIIAGTKNVTGQYVQNGNLNNFDLGSFGKDVFVGAATGFITGYVSAGVGGAITSTLSKTAVGSTLLNSSNTLVRMGTNAVIGCASEVGSGIVARGAVTLVTTGSLGETVKEMFDPKSIMLDAISGTVTGAIGGIKKPKKTTPVDDNVNVEKQPTQADGGVTVEKKPELKDGPYIKDGKPNGRPTPTGKKKLEFEQAVYDAQVSPDGVLRDPNTGEVIDWKPGQSRKDVVDFGHKAGKEYIDVFNKYKSGEITLDQLKEFQFDPNNFQIEVPHNNRGHLFEGGKP